MKPFFLLLLLLPLGACAAHVTHPQKSTAEMQADIDQCSRKANHDYWFDPVAALYHAYDCLEAKGYQRDEKDFAAQVDRAFGEERRGRPASAPAQPCRVPCRR